MPFVSVEEGVHTQDEPPLALIVSEDPRQIFGLFGLKLTEGNVFTFTLILCDLRHPFTDTVTVYIASAEGFAKVESLFVEDKLLVGLHVYVAGAPKLFVAVNKTESPWQIDAIGGFIVTL